MARKNKLKKTKYTSIYEIIADDTTKQYIARFAYLGKNYGERNFSNLFGVRTAKQAFEKLQEVKVEIAKYGTNPFKRKIKSTLDSYFEEYIKTRTNKKQYGDKYKKQSAYKSLVKEPLGDKNIDEITVRMIENILNKDLKSKSARTKLEVKNILKPLFDKATKNGLIKYSPLDEIKFEKVGSKTEITYRIVNSLDDVVKELYKNIMDLKNLEDKIILLIALMTARRKGEILQLEYSFIKGEKVFVPTGITKTSTVDEFPLPIEVLDLLPQLKTNKGTIFTCNNQRPTLLFNKIVAESNIEFTEDNKITLHDTRNLFSSVMSPITNNPPLVDRCLSHSQSSILKKYMSFSYASRKEVFEQYWDILRA